MRDRLMDARPAERRRVLIVEDEIVNRELLGLVLQEKYDLTYSESGREALELVRQGHDGLALVLLDLNLPDIHGLDVLQQIKSNATLAHVPVIVLTADHDAEVESLTLGAEDFIPKPYPKPEVIQARVARTLELSDHRVTDGWTERDPLTGLYNREFFYRLAEEYDAQHPERDMDAIVVDINHFSMINERYGKAYADRVLKYIARTLRGLSQGGGLLCRRSADTFLIYCPHRSDYSEMLEAAADSLAAEGMGEALVRLRMGVYARVDKAIDIERRFDRAKLAADTARSSFTKTVAIYDNALHESAIFAEHLLTDFYKAIEQRQFRVYYQPKYDVRGDVPVLSSAEALVRWIHPEFGMINPGVFIPLFEGNGLILELDHFVWREACAQMRDWKDRLGASVPISVNVSRVDILDDNLVAHMEGLVKEFGLTHRELMLEITESAYTENSDHLIETVNRLRQAGFLVEMDDFGSGYSSLNLLTTLPIDVLKMDMQFIRNVFKDGKKTRMLDVVIKIADSLSLATVAEGVETAEQMLTLKTMGCDIVQGYFFSKPVPPEEFEAFLLHSEAAVPVPEPAAIREIAHDNLAYAAMHDPVTGLYNHSAFDILLYDADQQHAAVLLADIDDYDALKNGLSPEGLQRALRRAAEVLRQNFRSADFVCRIRDDEFAMIVNRVSSAMKDVILEKVTAASAALQAPGEGLPPMSLIMGIAFGDRENPRGDIFQDADAALSEARARKCGCVIYGA